MMLQDFSSGYYSATMDIQEYQSGPAIEQSLYDFINRNLYVDSTVPVMMRIGLDAGATFEVDAESAIPRDVLALPEELFERDDTSEIFVLKAEYADTVGKYYG